MSQTRRASAFLALLVLATTFLMADVMVADATPVRDVIYMNRAHNTTIVSISLQLAAPGDVVVVPYTHYIYEPLLRYDFFVMDQDGAEALATGAEPSTIHFERRGLTAEDCCGATARITRPPGTGDRLALVWVYQSSEIPGEDVAAFLDEATEPKGMPQTVPRGAVVAHRLLLTGVGLSALGAATAGAAWFLAGPLRLEAPLRGRETEALLSLVYAGRRQLETLRAILLAALAFLLLTGFVVLSLFFIYLSDFIPAPVAGWHAIVRSAFFGVWAALAAAALVGLVRLQRALRRWQAAMDQDPLGP